MGNILNLQYPYEQIYAAVTHLASRDKSKLSFFAIGGGGYVFPRYVEKVWPGSHIDVAEIDPQVTEAAIHAFGLGSNTSVNTYPMDARNYIDELLYKKQTGSQIPRYEFVYGDAFNDYSVPYQLTTKEFNDKIAQILTDDGVYMINLIDIYDSGFFAGAVIKTLQQTFPYVYIATADKPCRTRRETFVVIAAMRKINFENPGTGTDIYILDAAELEALKTKAHGTLLTDNYAPVENMLTPVVRQSAISYLSAKYTNRISKLESQGKLNECLTIYKKIVKLDPTKSIMAYNNMGQILASQGKWQQAIDAAKSAIEYIQKAKVNYSTSDMYYNISLASKKLDRDDEASEYIYKAIEGYREDLDQEPNSVKTLRNLGAALAEINRFSEATEYLQQAINIGPLEAENYLMFAKVLSMQNRYDDAIALLKKAINSFWDTRDERSVVKLQRYLRSIEDSKNANKK
jgi:tetratricopeptide (TPR) repeat protein